MASNVTVFDYEICYGALYDAAAKVLGRSKISSDLSATNDNALFTTFLLRPKDNLYLLYSETGAEFAVLDIRTASKLNALKGMQMVRFEAVVRSSIFAKRQRGGKQGSQSFPVSINIFGSKSTADDVASRLSKLSAYLQHPEWLHTEAEYHNPQFLPLADRNLKMNDLIGLGSESPWNLKIKISEEIGSILESLTHVAAEDKIEYVAGLTSTLKRHQKDGFHFILQREDEGFSKQLSLRLRQDMTVRTEEPSSIYLGGLIADAMGLGKTLTILAVILYSVPEAEVFGNFSEVPEYECLEKIRTKATLVVVSSAQLLESWESEILAHISSGTLSSIRFHGQNRSRDPETLRSVDIVLTTYATLAADHASQRILHKMEWYRVVLDEAHWIRNSSSKQFRAAASLHTRRRWCLTGTPIQNKLEDLTSLAQFLQLPPLSTKAAFQKQILGPLSEGGPNFAKPLRTYLESYCLRRSEKCLTLPPSQQEDVPLKLSPEEQHLYNLVLYTTKQQIDSLVSKGDTIKCKILFTAMLRMRMLCNVGTFPPAKANRSSLGQPDLEVGCERCLATDEDALMLLTGYSFCPDCGRKINLSSPLPNSVDSLKRDTNNCRKDTSPVLDEVAQVLEAQTNMFPKNYFSTKLSAVVQNVASSGSESKSIVFSYWTSTLDLLSQLFEQAKIPYHQIDGRVGYAERSTRLKAFREDPRVLVLLMSIETGAVGLNLTVASRVHIVEPQWNPSVEEQAIARALRMGQTREVTIIRYMMLNTVEQNIIALQQKKKRLAKFTFDAGTEETISGTLEDLKSVLDIGSVK
ncbi:SNF2 family N-terminal domain-containing protein [Biscogniauxia sp. FL1348]|nr:SNF2 family N-terminal domain-containing protein [Biscogniauxia sp. FL1348]